jgi:hypothetical protein
MTASGWVSTLALTLAQSADPHRLVNARRGAAGQRLQGVTLPGGRRVYLCQWPDRAMRLTGLLPG